MRYHIDTIPVWDALKAGRACMFCLLKDQLVEGLLDSVLGGAAMEPARRVETNTEGFCGSHFLQLTQMRQALPLSLITHTHLIDVQKTLNEQFSAMETAVGKEKRQNVVGRAASAVKHDGPAAKAAREASKALRKRTDSCHICRRVDETIARYLYTLCHLWRDDAEFRSTFTASGTLCLPHTASLLDSAADHLSGEALTTLLECVMQTQRTHVEKEQQSLFWFTQKFDYRNRDKPWNDSRMAPQRSMNLLRSACVQVEEDEREKAD